MKRFQPSCESFEPRLLPTMVFVFNGNAFAEARPNLITQLAADQIRRHGNPAIQLTTPAMDNPGAFYRLARVISKMSQGRPIGLMGYSAGGSLAMRLAEVPGLNVKAVMNFYGPPDFRDWLTYHRGDRFYRYVTSHVRVTPGFVRLTSGTGNAQTYVVSAFGLRDANIESAMSTQSFQRDYPDGRVYYYPGPHGVSLFACYPAFRDFLSHL